MSEVHSTQWSRVGAWIASGCASAAAIACGAAPPPPHTVEVPIDQFQAAPGPAPTTPSLTPVEVADTTPPPPADAPGAAAAGGRPTPTPAPAADTGGIPPGQRLSASDCGRLVDKGAVLFGVGQGMSVAKAQRAVAKLRTQAASDATFAKVQASCADTVTKTQATCGMKASSLDKWKACVE